MSKNILKLPVVFAMLFSSFAYAADGVLQVKCVDSSGALLKGVKVTITCLSCPMSPGDSLKNKDEKSNDEGIAEFKKLDSAVYRVFGRKQGFAPKLYEYIDLQASPLAITLELAAGEDRKLYFEDLSMAEEISGMNDAGMRLYKSGNAPEAIKMLEESIRLNPSNLDTYFDLADIYLSESNFDRGEELLKQISHIASMLAKVYNPFVQPGYYREMLQNSDTKLNEIPVLKADDALQKKNYDAAISGFQDLIAKNSSDTSLYARLAVAFANTQKYDEALRVIEKATELDPGDEATIDLRKQILIEKTKADFLMAQNLVNEGDTLVKAGDFENALAKFNDSLALLPENIQSPIWKQIGLLQAELNRGDQAVESFKKSIALAPQEMQGDYIKPLFQHYLSTSRYEEALSLLVDPEITEPADEEKILLMAADQYANTLPKFAAAALERAIVVNPGNIDAHFLLGQIYYTDGKEYDMRTRKLLNSYGELGDDPEKLEKAKNMLTVVNERSPEETVQ